MRLKEFNVLGVESPLGIDRMPVFTWKASGEENNSVLTRYRIFVTDSNGNTVWDSEEKADLNNEAECAGMDLESFTKYTAHIDVWSNTGELASKETNFETAMMDTSDWQAQWVFSTIPVKKRKKGFGNQASPTFFRRDFHIGKKINSARLYATCHGVYKAYLNGKAVDNRTLAPEYTSYDKYLCYQTYDISDLLNENANCIVLYVGDGWYFNPETAMSKGAISEPHAALFEIRVAYEDGTVEMFGSDEHVKVNNGPVVSADLFAGEDYDARREIKGCLDPEFDMSTWKRVRVGEVAKDNLVAQIGEPVRVIKEFPVKDIYKSPKGETIVDFGQNFAGKVRLNDVSLPEGFSVSLDLFEATDNEGNYFNNILADGGVGVGTDQRIRFTSSGETETYTPFFMFSGFRYARVSGWDDIRKENLTGLALSTDMEEAGTFSCSSKDLNQLYSNIRWSQFSNMLSIPTDCPQREKAGWTGDIAAYASTALQNENASMFLERWLESLSVDQQKGGAIPVVSPFNVTYQKISKVLALAGKNKGPVGVAGWGDACVIVPWTIYQTTGSTIVLQQHYAMMKKWCEYIIQSAKRRGDRKIPADRDKYLWNTGFHFGEWLIPSTAKEGATGKGVIASMKETPAYVGPAYGYNSINLFSQIAGLLGKDSDQKVYGECAKKMKEAIADSLIIKENAFPWNFMGAYVILLHFGLVPQKYKEAYVEKLVSMIHENGDRLDTGFLATPFLLDVLSDNGYNQLAWKLLFQTEAPSWLYEVKHGATTIWESWFGYQDDGTPQKVSLNHYAFGCVADWIFRHISGIQKTSPGYRTFRIEPDMDSGLTFANRSVESPYGTIRSEWKKDNGDFILNVEVPYGTEAEIKLPNGETIQTGNGKYMYTCEIKEDSRS